MATGNIGIEVVKQLSAAQMGFRAAVHSESNAEKILEISTKVELAEIDYDKPGIVKKLSRMLNRNGNMKQLLAFFEAPEERSYGNGYRSCQYCDDV